MMAQKDIILLGIQGCGKGTQADLLGSVLSNHRYYEMGQTLRAFHSNDNLIGNYMKNIMNHGEMVDNIIPNGLIKMALYLAKHNDKFLIIDGYPRLEDQIKFLIPTMHKLGRDFVIIHYKLSEEKALERIESRSKIEGRADDNIEAVKKRISIFETETMQLINEMKELGKVIEVDADDSIENIFENTRKQLGI